MSIFSKLKKALGKTSSKISNSIDNLVNKKKLDNKTLEELEETLLLADCGYETSHAIIEEIRKRKFDKEINAQELKIELSSIIDKKISSISHEFELNDSGLNVILVCGVNGNGKTTTIGKMASIYAKQGKKIGIAACDTFRAAAVMQIEEWADRSGAELFKGDEKADPASVAYKAVSHCANNDYDILFIDTAGRLHNQKNLMQELDKINRTIKKVDSTAPHKAILVLDGTTGQNAHVQLEYFREIVNITGVIITKLDGTAKAGSVLGIVDNYKMPIYFIGVGEKVEDLKLFQTKDFSQALVGF